MKFKIDVQENTTLFEVISHAAPISSNNVKKLIKSKEAKVNGTRVAIDIALKKGDIVEAFIPDSFIGEMPQIIYEDENVLIVNKPILIEVNPTLTRLIKGDREFCEPMHRLDRNTAGIVAYALNRRAYRILYDAFKERKVEKHYITLIKGNGLRSGEYVAYLFKDEKNAVSRISDKPKEGYKKIVTRIYILKEMEELSLADIELVTGRTHQIRAHLSYLKHPILGDEKYGDPIINKKFKARYQKLCAYKLIFHSLNGEMSYLNEKDFEVKAKFID